MLYNVNAIWFLNRLNQYYFHHDVRVVLIFSTTKR